MTIYWITLCFGFGGLALIALLGHGHHHSAGNHSAGGHCSSVHVGHSVRCARGGHHRGAAPAKGAAWSIWPSPQKVLSLLLGFGATGILLHAPFPAASDYALALPAALGAWGFERGVVRPFWDFLFNFASRPARTLETAVRGEGLAASNFDDAGHGLVALDVDGQVIQLLGRLRGEERSAGWRVRSGDRVFVREVDPRRTHCTVSLVAP